MDQILPPELDDLELEALREIAAHPASHNTTSSVEARFKDIGYAKEVLGGLVLTDDGLRRAAALNSYQTIAPAPDRCAHDPQTPTLKS
jgi:hypothetical protein